MRGLCKGYRPMLDLVLNWPKAALSGALLLVALSGVAATSLGSEFIPDLDEGDIAMHAMRIPGTSLTQSIAMQEALEKRIRQFPEVERVFARSEEHTSELQSLMRISYAVFCLKK